MWFRKARSYMMLVPLVASLNANANGLDLLKEIAVEIKNESLSTQGLLTKEIPDGLSAKAIHPQCDPRRFEESLLSKKLSTSQFASLARSYFVRCQGELTENNSTGLLALLAFTQKKYYFLSHPQIRKDFITLKDGIKVPAIFAIKDDSRPRPLVVVRCGVFCSAGQTSSLMNYMMNLFDQSPFNVVFLSSQTGMDYIYTNSRVSMGGWSEGYETLEVGSWLRNKWQYRDRISSMHMMGISLGGNAAVIGAGYNDEYVGLDGRKMFNSVTAICPVISLQPTLKKLYGSQIVGRVFTNTTKNHFREARHYVKDVPDLLVDENIPGRLEMPNFIGEIVSTSLQRRGIASTTSSFFKSNNFWNLKNRVKTPLLVWASKDDSVVNNAINAEVFEYDDYYEKSESSGVLNLRYGNHCAFSASYGDQAAATILRTFVLKNSPEFINDYQSSGSRSWDFGAPKLGIGQAHVEQKWEFFPRQSSAKVTFEIFNGRAQGCTESTPWQSQRYCVWEKTVWVPIAKIAEMGARVPRTEVEAQAITREFNTKVEFKSQGKPIAGTRGNDLTVSWKKGYN